MSFLQWRNHPKQWVDGHFNTFHYKRSGIFPCNFWVKLIILEGLKHWEFKLFYDIWWLPWFLVQGYDSPVLNLNSNYSWSRIIFHYGEICSFIVLGLWKGRFHSISKLWHHHSSLSQLTALRSMCLVFILWSFQSHCRPSDCVLGCNITRLSDWVTVVLVVSRWAVFITMDSSQLFFLFILAESWIFVIYGENVTDVSMPLWYFTYVYDECAGTAAKDTECPRRNGQNFGRVFLMLKYTDITQNTYVQSW